MKKILCYGDSNTFGLNPSNFTQYDEDIRWSGILTSNLSDKFEVIVDGLNNRNGFVNNPDGFEYSAQRHFPKIIAKFKDNLDILILAVGTNDLQFQYDISFGTIEKGLENLISTAVEKSANHIILIPPVILNENILNGFFKNQFNKTSIEKSKKIGKSYRKLAKLYNCKIFDINEFATPSDIDGLHYSEISHKIIAEKLTEFINRLINNGESNEGTI